MGVCVCVCVCVCIFIDYMQKDNICIYIHLLYIFYIHIYKIYIL